MKKLLKYMFAFMFLTSLLGCSMFKDKNEEVEVEKNEIVEKEYEEESTLDDMMSFIKEKISYDHDERINEFDFAAKEGTSFNVGNEKVYLYRVDENDETMRQLLNNASANNKIQTNQNGVNKEYKAAVNGSYLLIYGQEADLDSLVDRFNEYKK